MKKINHVGYRDVNITGGFWHNRQKINAEKTAQAVYDRFSDSHRFSALACKWKEGMPNQPHVFWDSDVAKWLEGAAYIIQKTGSKHLEALCENAIGTILQNQTPEGYFNSHYQVVEKDMRFTNRDRHELYCAGHLMEAACAYYEATGKDAFLKAMCRYADYIYDTFYVYQTATFATCGHPEIELALLRLYETTGNEKYFELSRHFLSIKGRNTKDFPVKEAFNMIYSQDHQPLLDQTEAQGHCVRAMYTYSGMADLARITEDEAYLKACEAIFEDVITRKMYITGGIGSAKLGESFTKAYFLPNDEAYTETCAAIAFAMFCRRMLRMKVDSRYADVVERIIYNGMLSGVSLDGRLFNYTNPLEIDPEFYQVNISTTAKRWRPAMQRVELFNCSCCPPNVLRFISSIADYIYSTDGNTLYVHQFMESEAAVQGARVTQKTAYPAEGTVTVSAEGGKFRQIALRIPGWCSGFRADQPYRMENGYAYFETDTVTVTFDMPVTLYEANPMVQNNAGCVSVTRGPVVYCLEAVDNGTQLRSVTLDPNAKFTESYDARFGMPVLNTVATKRRWTEGLYRVLTNDTEQVELKFIPYYAFANRGVSEMLVWIPVR